MKNIENILPSIIDSLLSVDPVKIILFGSIASGDQNEDSDIDLVVILNKETLPQSFDEKLENKVFVRNAILEISFEFPIDLLVYTKKEFSQLEEIQSPFLQEITQKGRVLYEKAS